jgi:hypothetical protein
VADLVALWEQYERRAGKGSMTEHQELALIPAGFLLFIALYPATKEPHPNQHN